jgi:hypothetical protein
LHLLPVTGMPVLSRSFGMYGIDDADDDVIETMENIDKRLSQVYPNSALKGEQQLHSL